ncbi:MAG TPA: hypothetical protein VFZ79_19075 [Acidimicrobiales bacterium]
MPTTELPYLDEHATVVAADAGHIWAALLDALDRSFSGTGTAGYARAVGCVDATVSGPRPLDVGSTVPGFRVATVIPGRELVLVGRHRFSSYAFTFRVEQVGPGRSRLRAESRAAFPGALGGFYRLLVVGTGAHVVLVRRLLATVRRRSEQRSRSGT